MESYPTFLAEEQKQVGVPVNQAAPMLEHTLIDAASLAERLSLWRGT